MSLIDGGFISSPNLAFYNIDGEWDVENVGVQLSKSCLMHPLKSVSGLIGIGPADEIEDAGSPCDRCELYNCGMRR